MIVYVGAGSGPLRDLIIDAGHGQMVSRQAGAFRIPKRGRWAFDNGAYTDFVHGVPFDNDEFLRRVRRIEQLPDERLPDWCVCPDMVGDRLSLPFSIDWLAMLKDYAPRLRWYLALQDQVHPDDVDHALALEPFKGLFIGGTTPWKLATSSAWVKFGHDRNLPVHIARVNGPNRLQWAVDIESDSVDGTGWVHAGARWIEYLLNVPGPSARLFPESTTFPRPFVAFDAFLRSILSSEERKEYQWSDPAEDPDYDTVNAMNPDEFVAWFNRMYGSGISVPKFRDEDEFREWRSELLAWAEHHKGRMRKPPEPF